MFLSSFLGGFLFGFDGFFLQYSADFVKK